MAMVKHNPTTSDRRKPATPTKRAVRVEDRPTKSVATAGTPEHDQDVARGASIAEKNIAEERVDELDLSGLTNAVGYALRRAQVAVFSDFLKRFAALDLNPAEYSAIVVIGDNPGHSQTTIADALGIKRSNFAVLLSGLERRSLVKRARLAADYRTNEIVLTDQGMALLAQARAVHDKQEGALAAILGPGGREALLDLAKRLEQFAE
jgi:DNA-binding MarR family transcriptional regulator